MAKSFHNMLGGGRDGKPLERLAVKQVVKKRLTSVAAYGKGSSLEEIS
jgi:hypothetical protein